MLKTPIARAVTLATLGATLAIPSLAQAAFVEDSKASLELRNFYFNRDFRQEGGSAAANQAKQEEWAQGFILRYESGFTDGAVGVGVDALGLLGVKLDSSWDRRGTQLLPVDRNGIPDEYSQLGATAKVKVSKSVLRAGTLMPKLPTVSSSDARLLPQTFDGVLLTSQEIDGLTFNAGRLYQHSPRNDSSRIDMNVNPTTGITGSTDSNEFWLAGGSYAVNKTLTVGYNYGNLEDNYKQHIFNVLHVLPIADGQSFKSDLRYARSKDDGNTNIDNKAFGAMFTYALSGHSFGLGYQKMSGDSGYAYLGGFTDPYLVNYVQIRDFARADERSWQARYDYNFAAMGIPGLTFMTRYITGDNFGADNKGKEWERDTDIAYVFQDGVLKNLGVRWRNATVRSSGAIDDVDENRLIVSYTIPLM